MSMAPKFFDLVKLALPEDVPPEELLALAPQEWWENKNYTASAMALRKSPRINWEAYLQAYPDVKAAHMDPCLHFLRHGIYEGRKLTSWNALYKENPNRSPLISIVINNYNNASYLSFCIQSVINQTLKDIEIIIVDDASTDSSREIIEKFSAQDSRVSGVFHAKNLGTFMGRKNGARASHGRYIMYVDSDDYISADACEKALEVISRGYDIVTFCVGILPHGYVLPERVYNTALRYREARQGDYNKREMIEAIFKNRSIFWQIAGKIYLTDVVLTELVLQL